MSAAAVLEVRGLSRSFGGVQAVSDLSFAVHSGEVLGLIGPNGAGKTTVLNLISGIHRPDRGQILVDGQDATGWSPQRITRLGVARTFQVVKPFTGLTMLENVAMGAMFGPERLSRQLSMARARETLELLGMANRADAQTSELTIADRKRLELARALAMRPRIILLDEVLAGLNPSELGRVVALIAELHRQGLTIVVIEHVMRAIMALSTRVLVLVEGRKLVEGDPAGVTQDERVIRAYLGERYVDRGGEAP